MLVRNLRLAPQVPSQDRRPVPDPALVLHRHQAPKKDGGGHSGLAGQRPDKRPDGGREDAVHGAGNGWRAAPPAEGVLVCLFVAQLVAGQWGARALGKEAFDVGITYEPGGACTEDEVVTTRDRARDRKARTSVPAIPTAGAPPATKRAMAAGSDNAAPRGGCALVLGPAWSSSRPGRSLACSLVLDAVPSTASANRPSAFDGPAPARDKAQLKSDSCGGGAAEKVEAGPLRVAQGLCYG